MKAKMTKAPVRIDIPSGATRLPGYIKPLDGLRAVAIVLVLLFHLNEGYLSGGFVGVDVFFVISGYIITRNILLARAEGRFRLVEFYQKRLARLWPSVIATVIVSLAAASFVYSPEITKELARSGAHSILAIANIHFWLQSGYFDDASQANIFLHMWSLSVEEQFYLLWPLLALVLTRTRFSMTAMAGLVGISLAASSTLASFHPAAAFYLMPARIFQFAIGGLIALAHLRADLPQAERRELLHEAGFAAGVAMIVAAAFFANGDDYRFAVAAVLPVVGAGLVIACIRSRLCERLLGAAPACFLGKRAYALYLVHWPAIVFAGVYLGASRPIHINAAIALGCLVLAEILHRLVERPFRIKVDVPVRGGYGAHAAGVVGAAAACLAALFFWTGAPDIIAPSRAAIKAADGDMPAFATSVRELWRQRARLGRIDLGCQLQDGKPYSEFNEEECVPYDPETGMVLIVGDSFTAETFLAMSKIIPAERLLTAGGAGCRPIYPPPNAAGKAGCRELNLRRFEWVRRDDIRAIILASDWRHWSSEQVRTTLRYMTSTGTPVLLFGARPVFSDRVPTLLDSSVGRRVAADLSSHIAYDAPAADAMLRAVAAEFGGQVLHVDLMKRLCPKGCPALTPDGGLAYLDTAHITADAAASLGEEIARKEGRRIRQHLGLDLSNPPPGR